MSQGVNYGNKYGNVLSTFFFFGYPVSVYIFYKYTCIIILFNTLYILR